MGFTLVYSIDKSLYLNITNRCVNNCVFCVRKNDKGIGYDYDLWLGREPTAQEVLDKVEKINLAKYDEIVFCGYGEPLLRPDIVIEVARELKKKYNPVLRINTNGLAEKALNKKFVHELADLIDIISISLNAHDAETYDKLCHSSLGIKAFDYMLEFTKECKKYIPKVILSVVDIPKVDIDKCKKLVKDLGVEIRVRSLIK